MAYLTKSGRRSVMLQFVIAFFATIFLVLLILLLRRGVMQLLQAMLRVILSPLRLICSCCCAGLCRRVLTRRDSGDAGITKADLGQASTFYFDKEKGKWRERGKEHLEEP